MTKCEYCGFENVGNSEYCVHCSKKLNNFNKRNSFEENNLKQTYYSFLEEYNFQSFDYSNHLNNYINFPNYYENLKKGPSNRVKFIAVLLSSIFCGFGYFYLKNWNKGLIFLFSPIILYIFASLLYSNFLTVHYVYIMYITHLIIYLINIYDTYHESCKVGVYHD